MRKRVIGAGAVILVALGIWLGNLFQGFGTGDGETDPDGSNGDAVQVSLTGDAVPSTTGEGDDAPPTTGTPDVLTLLVDDDQYLVQWGEDWHAEFSPSTLEDIVARAKEVPGDENGVRVRLRFKENAQNGAIDDLTTALTDAGVEPEAIVKESGYVE